VEGRPYNGIWGIGCYATEPAAQRRETWRGINLLGEILTEVKEEMMLDDTLKLSGSTGNLESSHISPLGRSLDPETDFGELQRKCPETNIFIDYLEKRILPVDKKWRRRIEHERKDYFMESGKL